jgi:hypothetical protein
MSQGAVVQYRSRASIDITDGRRILGCALMMGSAKDHSSSLLFTPLLSPLLPLFALRSGLVDGFA